MASRIRNSLVDQVLVGKPITITNPEMTRFMMTLERALDLVLYAFENGKNGDIFVQKALLAIETLAHAILNYMGKPDHPVHVIGTRHGESLTRRFKPRRNGIRRRLG